MELAETAPAMIAVVELTPRLEKKPAQFLQRATHAYLRRIFARAQRRADLLEIPAFKKSQHDGVVVFLTEPLQRPVEQRRDLSPSFFVYRFVCSFVQNRLHVRLLFAMLPPPLNGQRIGARIARRAA